MVVERGQCYLVALLSRPDDCLFVEVWRQLAYRLVRHISPLGRAGTL